MKALSVFCACWCLLAAYATAQTSLANLESDMITIKGGTFMMGCMKLRDGQCKKDETPAHKVAVSSYQLSKYEVTQMLYYEVMKINPSEFNECAECPVENISWIDAQVFIKKLDSLTGKKFRLPTEAEWEFAARSGQRTKGFMYSGSNTLDEVAWYEENSEEKTHPVGTKKPNMLGFYDMTGNVWEWCQDWYGEKYYANSPINNPKGPENGESRVLRTGSWYGDDKFCRIANRGNYFPESSSNLIGFRLARDITK